MECDLLALFREYLDFERIEQLHQLVPLLLGDFFSAFRSINARRTAFPHESFVVRVEIRPVDHRFDSFDLRSENFHVVAHLEAPSNSTHSSADRFSGWRPLNFPPAVLLDQPSRTGTFSASKGST